MCIVAGIDRGGFCAYMERGMPGKRESTVCVGYNVSWFRMCLISVLGGKYTLQQTSDEESGIYTGKFALKF